MTSQRLLQRTFGVMLIALLISGYTRSDAQVMSGIWDVPTGFGTMAFTVNSAGTHITEIIFRWSREGGGWKCGTVTKVGGSFTIKYNVAGLLISNRQFSLQEFIDPYGTLNQKMTITGTFNQTGDVASGTWIAVIYGTTCSGSWGPAGPGASVVDIVGGIPGQFVLAQNYPNPFNPTTVVSYQLPAASDVKLVVFDMLGRELSVLVNERRDAGVHEVKFDASGLSGGVYFYRLQAGDFVATKRLLLLR